MCSSILPKPIQRKTSSAKSLKWISIPEKARTGIENRLLPTASQRRKFEILPFPVQLMAQIIGILNPKGGCGKTTLTVNLARAIQEQGKSALIVDTDPQGTARDWSLAAQENFPDTKRTPLIALDRPTIHKDLPELAASFDFVLLDGAAKLQQMTSSTLQVTDIVLIPVQPSLADVWSASDLVALIKERQTLFNGKPKAAFIVSRQTANTRLASDISEVLTDLGLSLLESRTTNRVGYVEALSSGSTVIDLDPRSPAALEIRAIARELLELAAQPCRA